MKRLIFTLAILLLSSAVSAFEAQIQEMVAANQWSEASQRLKNLERACQQTDHREECALRVRFSRAWVFSQRAGQEKNPDRRKRLLGKARDDYLAILKLRPRHQATIDNLVLNLQKLGDRRGLQRLFKSVTDRKRAANIARIIADSSLDAGDAATAFSFYSELQRREGTAASVNGMINAFEMKPRQRSADRLLQIADKDLGDKIPLRSRIYAALATASEKISPATFEQAVLQWVSLHGEMRNLSAELVEKTFDLDVSSVMRELYKRLRSPYLGAGENRARLEHSILDEPSADGWWSANIPRNQALALAGWSAGHVRLLDEGPVEANNLWLGALYYAPPQYAYDDVLQGQRAVALELLTDLARLQQFHPKKLDPRGNRFSAIEDLLFESKAGAYQVNDIEAMYRHHTVLGKMYADLGIFGQGIRGSRFQLTRAIETAQEISTAKGIVAPQPLLSRLLADGYNCKLQSQSQDCQKKTVEARKWYAEAATGYLELDAVRAAGDSIKAIQQISPQLSTQENSLQMIIELRSNPPGSGAALETFWKAQPLQTLPQEFITRQQFKVYAESGLKGDAASQQKALSISTDENLYKNLGDLGKIQQLNRITIKGN